MQPSRRSDGGRDLLVWRGNYLELRDCEIIAKSRKDVGDMVSEHVMPDPVVM